MKKLASQAQSLEALEQQEMLKKRAARQAAKGIVAPHEIVKVTCTVLPQGDSKISMGEHVAGMGTAHYEEGETFEIEMSIAVSLYDRGYVNFEGGRQASLDAAQARKAQERYERGQDDDLRRALEDA